MKTRERVIPVVVVLVLVPVAAVTYFSRPLWVSASEPTAPESQTNRPVEATELANQLTAAQGRIAQLEKALECATAENDFPGLHTALKDMIGIVVEERDLPLEAVRYGLTKKNVIDAVKARLGTHGIRAMTFDEGLSSADDEGFLIVRDTSRPRLRVEVEFQPRGATYIGCLCVSMQQYKEVGLDNDGGSPEVAKAAREWSQAAEAAGRAHEDMERKKGAAKAAATKKCEQAFKYAHDLEAKWTHALKQVQQDFIDGRPPRKPIRQWNRITCWEYRLTICGALADFAEDERNGLDQTIDYFAGEFLKANPIQPK